MCLDKMQVSIALQLEDAKGQTQPNSKKGGRQPTCNAFFAIYLLIVKIIYSDTAYRLWWGAPLLGQYTRTYPRF
jgi:hypothetical protein